jgi:hypothetical protein
MCSPADWFGLGKLCVSPPGRNKRRANGEIGRVNGSVCEWAVIDRDPRNADDHLSFSVTGFWHGQG